MNLLISCCNGARSDGAGIGHYQRASIKPFKATTPRTIHSGGGKCLILGTISPYLISGA